MVEGNTQETEQMRNWYATYCTNLIHATNPPPNTHPNATFKTMLEDFDVWLKGIKSEVWYEAMNSVEDPHYWRDSPYD